jgi:hypothetical protein
VRVWFPLAEAITYSPITKSQMVYKAKNVITAGRLNMTAVGVTWPRPSWRSGRKSRKRRHLCGKPGGGVGHADFGLGNDERPFLRTYDITQPLNGGSTLEIF